MSMLSMCRGSSGGVLNPSPRSPIARDGRSLFTASMMHSSGRGRFREQVSIVDAGVIKRKRGENDIFGG